jgi:hypothetical protein
MMTNTNNVYGIEDDPTLGIFVAFYPSNRLRLLLIAGGILLVVWFVITVLLWQVEAGVASTVTVIVLALAALVVGWFMLHLWNRAVIVYARGFSYREGSRTALIPFDSIATVRQRAERRQFFGGLVRHTIYELHLLTHNDEQIMLNGFYNRMDELSLRLERQITEAQLEAAHRQLAGGGTVSFEGLTIDTDGLRRDGEILAWDAFGGHQVRNRRIDILDRQGNSWAAMRLSEVPNLRLLIELLREHTPDNTTPEVNTA